MTAKKQAADEEVSMEEGVSEDGAQANSEINADPKDEPRTVVYIGPTVPNTTLVENVFVSGTNKVVNKYFESGLCKHPSAKALIIPTDALAESRERLKAAGSYLGRIYAEIETAIKSK